MMSLIFWISGRGVPSMRAMCGTLTAAVTRPSLPKMGKAIFVTPAIWMLAIVA